MWKMSLPYLDSPITESKLLSSPPAFAIASPSPDLGEAMAKVGGEPSCRAGAEPRPSWFFAGNSAAIAALFAPWPAEVCQVDSAVLASRSSDS